MLERLVLCASLCAAVVAPVCAEQVRFEGTFSAMYDCGKEFSACIGEPPPVSIDMPFAFTINVTELAGSGSRVSSQWVPPSWLLPPPVTQQIFDGLLDRTYTEYFRDRAFVNGAWNASRGHSWSGTDPQGVVRSYDENIYLWEYQVIAPTSFAALVAMFEQFRDNGNEFNVHSDASYLLSFPDGSSQGDSRRLIGQFRVVAVSACPAPKGMSGAIAAFASSLLDWGK